MLSLAGVDRILSLDRVIGGIALVLTISGIYGVLAFQLAKIRLTRISNLFIQWG